MNDGVPPGLTNDEVSPLDNHYGNEERRVTRVFQNLPLSITLEKRNSIT